MHAVLASRAPLALALFAMTGLAACGGGTAPGPGDFAAACNAQGNLSADICDCLDEQAQGLSPETHAFVIATIAEDEAEAQRLRPDLDEAQALAAGQFISRGIQECIIDLPDMAEG
ncbi:MAG: hypothetical protein ACTS1X_10590 [Parasphingopyxis sp.]|uniref:hypothetical protein n=1 Tax=Parasphingopyxis sp. TaxID=1920299 RepID=UPI003F9F38D7